MTTSGQNKTRRPKTPRAKSMRPARRKAEPQAEASIPLAELSGRKKPGAPKIEVDTELLAYAHDGARRAPAEFIPILGIMAYSLGLSTPIAGLPRLAVAAGGTTTTVREPHD